MAQAWRAAGPRPRAGRRPLTDPVGLIGWGAIGSVLGSALREAAGPPLAGVLVRPAHVQRVRGDLGGAVPVVTTVAELLDLSPDLVVECAGQGAVRDYGAEVLASGTDLMVVSTGALAEPGLLDRLAEVADANRSRIVVPAGAIAGLDGIGALKCAGLRSVTYTSAKPPLAWRGTPAEKTIDLGAVRERTVFFEGSAREAALAFPKNANLAATVALAGIGLDLTVVRLVADPEAGGNTGTVEASSEIGDLRVVMSGRASANPKTSASTAYSLLHAIRSRAATVVI